MEEDEAKTISLQKTGQLNLPSMLKATQLQQHSNDGEVNGKLYINNFSVYNFL